MEATSVWRVYVMEYARSKDQPWVDLISGMYHEGTMDLPFSFILAQRDDRNVLVDTGFMQEEHGSGFTRKFGIPTWISPVRMLAEMNLSPDAITDIVLTHAHFDHMGSIAEFPNAHIYIQKSELLSWYEAFALPPAFRSSDRDRRSRQHPHSPRCFDRSSRHADRRRQEQCFARASRPTWKRTHDRSAIRDYRDEGRPPGHLGRLRLFAAPVHRP